VNSIIDNWNTELKQDVEDFHEFAAQVYQWDKEILDSEKMLSALCEQSGRVNSSQKDLKNQIEAIKSQQESLDTILNTLESRASKFTDQKRSDSDMYRQQTYNMAQSINHELDSMSEQLNNTLNLLNQKYENTLKSEGMNTAMEKIVRILDVHLRSLQCIDEESDMLEQKMKEIQIKLTKS